jgi:hypothetical protein
VNKWQDSLINLLPVLMFMWVCDMLRPILAPEVEKGLGRKLTDGEWLYYLLESYRKGEAEQRRQIVRQLYQQLADMKTIHDFVWNG